jgi:hypothetical protein
MLGTSLAQRQKEEAARLITLIRVAAWGDKEQMNTTMRALE